MKIINTNFKKIFLNIIFFVSISFTLFFLCHKNFLNITNHDINLAISKRLADYQDVFSYLENSHDNTDNLQTSNILSNKNLYLYNRKLIPLGTIEISCFSSLKTSKNQPPDSSDQTLGKVFCSKAFMDLNFINEPLVRLTYTFLSKENDLITCSTTVLAKDLFVYAQNIRKITVIPNKKKYTEQLFFIPLIDIFASTSSAENIKFFILMELLLSTIYLCVVLITTHRKNKKALSFYSLNMNLLEGINSELVSKNKFLREIEYPSARNIEEDICPFKIINHLISLHEAKSAGKNIKCNINNNSSELFFRGNKADWHVLLGSFVEVLIAEAPPNSILYCSIKETCSPSNGKIFQINFKDEFPIFRNLEEKIFSNSFCYTYAPNCNLADLITRMNVFVNFSFCEKNGNSTSLALPILGKEKRASNVVLFSR